MTMRNVSTIRRELATVRAMLKTVSDINRFRCLSIARKMLEDELAEHDLPIAA